MSTRTRASIVTYKTNADELSHACSLLRQAGVVKIDIIDNSPDDRLRSVAAQVGADYTYTGKNLGYGSAHNISLRRSLEDTDIDYHLVMNSDVDFAPEVIANIVKHMDANPCIGQLAPHVAYPNGDIQPTVRLLPTPIDLVCRRFLPKSLNRRRNRRYTLADWAHDTETNIPFHQGCFMFLRTNALKEVGLFDERYFMYAEDIDLTRRMHRLYETNYWPEVTITHNHRAGSYHSLRLLRIHAANVIKYFNKWGWFKDPERRQFNRRLLDRLNP